MKTKLIKFEKDAPVVKTPCIMSRVDGSIIILATSINGCFTKGIVLYSEDISRKVGNEVEFINPQLELFHGEITLSND